MTTGAATLRGNELANVLYAGAGNNVLSGGAGRDSLAGGDGKDIYDFDAVTDTGVTAATWDVITGFVRGADRIDLRTLDANGVDGDERRIQVCRLRGLQPPASCALLRASCTAAPMPTRMRSSRFIRSA